jgi:hypothetical protein
MAIMINPVIAELDSSDRWPIPPPSDLLAAMRRNSELSAWLAALPQMQEWIHRAVQSYPTSNDLVLTRFGRHGWAQITQFGAASDDLDAAQVAEHNGGSARGYPRAFVPLESRPTAGRAGG